LNLKLLAGVQRKKKAATLKNKREKPRGGMGSKRAAEKELGTKENP